MRGPALLALGASLVLVVGMLAGPAAGTAEADPFVYCPGSIEVPSWHNANTQALVKSTARVRCPGQEPLRIKARIQFHNGRDWRTYTGPYPCNEARTSGGEEAVVDLLMDTLCGETRYRATLQGVRIAPDRAPEGGSKTTRDVTLTRSKGCGNDAQPSTGCDPEPGEPACRDF